MIFQKQIQQLHLSKKIFVWLTFGRTRKKLVMNGRMSSAIKCYYHNALEEIVSIEKPRLILNIKITNIEI